MAYEKYDQFVPSHEQAGIDPKTGHFGLVPRVNISFKAHAFVRDKINEAARAEGISSNEWLCNAVIDALTKQPT